jgi:hypothetical protein
MKVVTDSDLIPVTRSAAMPVTIGAKRRGAAIVLEVTGIGQTAPSASDQSQICCLPFRLSHIRAE